MADAQGSRRALIVKLGAIGDVVMVIPAARLLYEQGTAIDWVCGRVVEPLLRLYPWINVLPVDDAALLSGAKAARLRAVAGVWRMLAGRRYDLVATLYYDPRYKLLTRPVRAQRRLSLSRTDRERLLVPGRHHTDEYARILTGRADAETPERLGPLPPPNPPPCSLPRVEGRRRAVLVPGGARNLMREDALRRWPVENYVTVARELIARGFEVVLAGGPGDRWASSSFAGLEVQDAIGKLSLVESLALMASVDAVVSHDTGPLHLAGLTAAALVAIFGPTSPHVFAPNRANAVALWGGEGFACRPCYDGKNFAPCSNNGCVQQITPEYVLAQLEELLAAREQGRDLPPRILTVSSLAERLVSLRSAPAELRPALFLDRDGVINEETNYLYRREEVRWVEGIFPLVRTAAELGYRVVVVTNQAGIARGYYTVEQFHELMDWMREEFRARGCGLDGVYYSPYHPQGEIAEYAREHEDRKPGPGMLRRAAQDLRLDLARSVLVGDRCSDIAAARAAGLRHAFLLRGTENGPCTEEAQVIASLGEAEAWLRAEAGQAG